MKTIEKLDEMQFLNRQEMLETSGGVMWIIPILIAAGCAAVEEVIRDWDNFKAGLLGNHEKIGRKQKPVH
jgi:hypothetical protein